ncbi:MAG TPA: macrolide family glycosyltransferase [Phototrophicaceae bacterium]|nr:macrolide family glycosyltransferase [Phototrophicaceae bacterium]
MSKAIFFNLPAHGHVNPSLSVVEELVRRGETIIYYATEEFRSRIEGTGAIFRPYTELPLADVASVSQKPLAHLGVMLLEGSLRLLPQVLEAAQTEKPDYLLVDSMCTWGWQVAEKLHLPAISSVSTFVFTPAAMLGIGLPGDLVKFWWSSRASRAEYKQIAQQLARRYGVSSPGFMDVFCQLGLINLIYTAKQLQPAANTLDDRFKFIGPSITLRQEVSDVRLDTGASKPVIYISLGTVHNANRDFYQTCFKALGENPAYQIVLSIGKNTDIASFTDIPSNFIVRNYVSQLEILQHADLFISHSGMNSVHEALYYGVPLLLVPQIIEQKAVASRVVKNGAGICLDKEKATPTTLRYWVDKLLAEPSFHQNAGRLKDALRAAGGAGQAADEIFQLKQRLAV